MNEMDLLTRLRAEVPATVSPRAVHRFHAGLAAERSSAPGQAPHSPSRWRGAASRISLPRVALAAGLSAAVAAGIVVAIPGSPGRPAPGAVPATSQPATGTGSQPATGTATGAPLTVSELAYRASAAALAQPALAPGQWVYIKKIQRQTAPHPPASGQKGGSASPYFQFAWKGNVLTINEELWQTADALKVTAISFSSGSLRVESNPTVGKDISYAELVRFRGDPRALANYIYHREAQILGPEPVRQAWFDTFYEMTGVFGWFVLPPRVSAEILRALPFVPGVRVRHVGGDIAFTDTGLARTDAPDTMTVSMTLDPVSFAPTSVRISSGKSSNQFDLVTRAPVSGPGVRP